ncbi:putative conserved tandem protein 10 [Amphidinium carterae]
MKSLAAVCLLALLSRGLVAADGDVHANVAGDPSRPVSKVVVLLKDMLKQLEKEAEDDEEIYEKMACWCETNDKEKTQAIADADAKITSLTSKIEELAASAAQLTVEIKNLEKEKERAKNQQSLDQATALREKQLAEFNAEEKDLLESIQALKAAITVLSKHHGGALLQAGRGSVLSIAATLQHELKTHAKLLEGSVLTRSERRKLEAFIQAPEDYLDSTPTFKQAYSPQSGEIFGILNQMKDTFELNLSDAQKEELANQKAYEGLKEAKEAEIAAGTAQINSKTQELAEAELKNAQAGEVLPDRQGVGRAPKDTSTGNGGRVQALVILSSDDARDLFTRTFNPSLLQKDAVQASDRRAQAANLLEAVAAKVQNPRLATLATKVKLNAFTRVKKAIDDMVAQLTKEKGDEIKHKDFCVGEFNENQLQTERKERTKEEIAARMADLEMTTKELGEAIVRLNGEIQEMQVQLKRAGEDRNKQNQDRSSKLSLQTSGRRRNFSGRLLQCSSSSMPLSTPRVSCSRESRHQQVHHLQQALRTYEKHRASSGVIALIQQIMSDAKAMETDTIRDENDAQKAYEERTSSRRQTPTLRLRATRW